MNEYIFIITSKDENNNIIKKAVYYKDIKDHLLSGWTFDNNNDIKIYKALKKFYMVMKNE